MELIEQLQATKKQTLEYFDLDPSYYDQCYEEGKWTIRQLLHHITDAETVLYERIRRIIAEQPKPLIWAFHQDDWARHLEYENIPLSLNKAVFSAVRDNIIYLVDTYYDTLGANEFVHSEMGIRTLKEEMEKVAWHCRHHLDQIELSLSKTKTGNSNNGDSNTGD